jgi:ADP-ribose pyrophosphatase YjhB (NUDIX family)
VKRFALRVWGKLPSGLKRFGVRLHEASFLVGVMGVVIDSDCRVLLFRHTYRPFAPWGLPSGHLRPDETPAEAIVREIDEETGLIAESQRTLEIRAGRRPQRLDVWLLCRVVGGTLRLGAEVEEVRFFPLDGLPDLIAEQARFLAEHREALVAAARAHRVAPDGVM